MALLSVGSAESASDVVFGLFALGLEKNLFGFTKFNQIAQVHVSGVV
jgi:hypothetical protein